MAAMCTPSRGKAARAWPSRSIRRESRGWPIAAARMNVAATPPATPYRPVSPSTSSTMPMPYMLIGSRATNAAAENAGPPGVRSSSA